MSGWAGFLYGVLGGAFGESLGLFRIRRQHPSKWPKYMRYPTYWAITLLKVIIGGALVAVYDASHATFTPILAVNVGLTAPIIIQALARQAPLEPGRVDSTQAS